MIGETLGHYRIEAKLGAGGMGEVYRAFDLRLHRAVALKFMQPELAGDPEAVRRFEQEARALAALDHPFVGAVHGVEQADGRTFMVLAFVEGSSLEALIAHGPLPPARARLLLSRIAEGLHAAHQRGVIHRDIKPANVMVAAGDVPKLVDFGIALRTEHTRLTATGHWVGTMGFTAPEIYRGEPSTPRSDLFSFGVMAYRVLTGRAPFAGDTPAAAMHGILNQAPPAFDPSLPAEARALEPLVRRCLEKDPALRFPDAGSLARALAGSAGATPAPQAAGATGGDTLELPAGAAAISPPRRRALPLVVMAAIGIAGAAALALWLGARNPRPQVAGVIERPNSVAILEFQNVTGDPALDWMKRAVSELLATAFAQSPTLDIYDPQRLADIATGPARPPGAEPAPAAPVTTAALQRHGIRRAITGSVLRSGNRLRLQGRIVNVATGQVIRAVSAEGASDGDLFALVGEMIPALQVALEVNVAGDREAEAWLREITTSSAEAYRSYLLGHQALVAARWVEASEHLRRAVALDSNFVAAWTDLVGTYWNLDAGADLDRARRKLSQLRDRADTRSLLRIDQMDAIIDGNPPELIRTSRALIQIYPENRFYRYLLARGQFTANDDRGAIATLEPLIAQRYEWPWTYMLTSRAFLRLGKPDSAEMALRRGIEVSPGNSELALDHALLRGRIGDRPGKRAILEAAAVSPMLAQTPLWRARILFELGRLDAEDGRVDSARARIERVVESLPEESGERGEARKLLRGLGPR